MKVFLKEHYKFEKLESIDKYPLNLNDSLTKFYKKILSVINLNNLTTAGKSKDLYCVRKKL